MKKFNHPTLKRTCVICNDEIVSSLDKGPLLLEEKQCEVATTKRYKSAAGKVKFCGTGALKSTQLLGKKGCGLSLPVWECVGFLFDLLRTYTPQFARAVVQMLPSLQSTRRNLTIEAP